MPAQKVPVDQWEIKRLRGPRSMDKLVKGGTSKGGPSLRNYKDVERTGEATEATVEQLVGLFGCPGGSADIKPVPAYGAVVKGLRERQGVSTEELSNLTVEPPEVIGGPDRIRKARIAEIERNDYCYLMHYELRMLSRALDCSINEMLASHPPILPKAAVEDLGRLLSDWRTKVFAAQDSISGGIKVTVTRSPCLTQVWSTCQALTGVLHRNLQCETSADAIRKAIAYVDRHRIPGPVDNDDRTPTQGWALYTDCDTPVTEITAWVLVVLAFARRAGIWSGRERSKVGERLRQESSAILRCQYRSSGSGSGGFCPTAEVCAANMRTYSTAMALWACAEISATR